VAAPVKIERFDNLSAWDIFQVPRLVEIVGSDHVAQMNVVLPVTCVGPLDSIVILVNISPNPDWPSKARKIRVSGIQVSSKLTILTLLGNCGRTRNIQAPRARFCEQKKTDITEGIGLCWN
jgi:hypothetical protein